MTTPPGALDLLLRWAGEEVAGTWTSFRQAHDWLMALGGERVPPAWRTAWTLSSLGHIEVDWKSGRWASSEPCLAMLPSAGAVAVLVGARPRSLTEAFWRHAEEEAPPELLAVEAGGDGAPTTLYVQFGSQEVLADLANQIGVRIEPRAAERICENLPDVTGLVRGAEPGAPPPRSYDVQRLNPQTLEWEETTDAEGFGLYRYRSYGDVAYLLFDDGYRKISREAGVWAVLARYDPAAIHYRPDSVNGELMLPSRAGLPLLHSRAAVLCTGLVPTREHGMLHFANVPRIVAETIARTLGQTIQEDPSR